MDAGSSEITVGNGPVPFLNRYSEKIGRIRNTLRIRPTFFVASGCTAERHRAVPYNLFEIVVAFPVFCDIFNMKYYVLKDNYYERTDELAHCGSRQPRPGV